MIIISIVYILPGFIKSGGFRFLALCLPSLSFGPHNIDYIMVWKSLSTVLFNVILVILILLLGWYITVVLYNNWMQFLVCRKVLAYDLVAKCWKWLNSDQPRVWNGYFSTINVRLKKCRCPRLVPGHRHD